MVILNLLLEELGLNAESRDIKIIIHMRYCIEEILYRGAIV
jgi:hypothetical protein